MAAVTSGVLASIFTHYFCIFTSVSVILEEHWQKMIYITGIVTQKEETEQQWSHSFRLCIITYMFKAYHYRMDQTFTKSSCEDVKGLFEDTNFSTHCMRGQTNMLLRRLINCGNILIAFDDSSNLFEYANNFCQQITYSTCDRGNNLFEYANDMVIPLNPSSYLAGMASFLNTLTTWMVVITRLHTFVKLEFPNLAGDEFWYVQTRRGLDGLDNVLGNVFSCMTLNMSKTFLSVRKMMF